MLDSSIQYCNTPQCKICRLQLLDTSITFSSNLANKQFQINQNGYCNTKNCVYMITCKQEKCHMKCIVFTTTSLNKRLAGHRANILNNTEGKVMLQHFKKHHNITDMIIKPTHSCAKEFLRNQETYRMQEINTIFPYGLNNRIAINNIEDAYNHITYNNETPIYKIK